MHDVRLLYVNLFTYISFNLLEHVGAGERACLGLVTCDGPCRFLNRQCTGIFDLKYR